jgi:hypothetical protein
VKIQDLARQAYEGFADHSNRGKPDRTTHLPTWEDLPLDIRVGWQIATLRTIDCIFSVAKHELLRDE